MKTKFSLVLLFSVFALAAQAQFPPYYFGLKASPQLSWMKPNTDTYDNEGIKLGFSWGFLAEFNFTENHSIATGFNMLFNGGKLSFPAASGEETGTMKREYFLKYIEVPMTLKMRTNDINGMKYFGRIGLGTAFKIGAKAEDEFTATDGSTLSTSKYNYDDVAFVRESLIVGLGAEYEIADGPKLGLELAFNNGFTNILKGKNTINNSLNEKATPNYFELAFSVIF